MNRLTFALGSLILVAAPALAVAFPRRMTVYKSPTCGCCEAWISYLESVGYSIEVRNEDDMAPIKKRFGIPASLESCHTGVIDGYVIEGHVPREAIERLLTSRLKTRGIALPGMPSGSPGMGGPKLGMLHIVQLEEPNKVFFMF